MIYYILYILTYWWFWYWEFKDPGGGDSDDKDELYDPQIDSGIVGKVKKRNVLKKRRIEEKKKYVHVFDRMYAAAKELQNNDYIFMKDVRFSCIPKRCTYFKPILSMPSNVIYHDVDDNGDKLCFSKSWFINNKDEKYGITQLIATDGSVKDGIGGAGFISCKL